MIDGVEIKQLTRHMDDRGYLMEILRDDDEMFIEFGQVYVSAVFPGIVKAWHCHEHQTDSFCVVRGNARIGLFDDRPDSPTCGEAQGIVCGDLKPLVVQIGAGAERPESPLRRGRPRRTAPPPRRPRHPVRLVPQRRVKGSNLFALSLYRSG